jgi:hypothetical protein
MFPMKLCIFTTGWNSSVNTDVSEALCIIRFDGSSTPSDELDTIVLINLYHEY